MTIEESGEVAGVTFTPWDRRVIAAIDVADGARRGVLFLRVAAAVIACAAVVGSALFIFSDTTSQGVTYAATFDRQAVGRFLAGVANPLAFAGIVFALSYLVQISAARLDVDIVLADEDEPESAPDANS
jgi:hypothetical protein